MRRWNVFAGFELFVATLVALVVLATLAVSPVAAQDDDFDGIANSVDNCTIVPNPGQLDSDCDKYGDACDTDFDNDGATSLLDIALWDAAPPSSFTLFDVAEPFNGIPDADDRTKVVDDATGIEVPGPSGLTAPACTAGLVGVHYCISGTGTGTPYSWQLSGGSVSIPHTQSPVAPAAPPANSHLLMLNFQNSIEAASATTGVAVDEILFRPGSGCFSLSDKLVTLKVGLVGFPTCPVTSGSACVYNPTIIQVGPASAPVLSLGGLVVLASLLGMGCFFLLRREREAQA